MIVTFMYVLRIHCCICGYSTQISLLALRIVNHYSGSKSCRCVITVLANRHRLVGCFICQIMTDSKKKKKLGEHVWSLHWGILYKKSLIHCGHCHALCFSYNCLMTPEVLWINLIWVFNSYQVLLFITVIPNYNSVEKFIFSVSIRVVVVVSYDQVLCSTIGMATCLLIVFYVK